MKFGIGFQSFLIAANANIPSINADIMVTVPSGDEGVCVGTGVGAGVSVTAAVGSAVGVGVGVGVAVVGFAVGFTVGAVVFIELGEPEVETDEVGVGAGVSIPMDNSSVFVFVLKVGDTVTPCIEPRLL